MLGIYVRTSKEDDRKESPIEQQKSLGIQFAMENKFAYEVYEDKGLSGFKIADDENDPFKNRPRFTDLINDIKARKIDKVWVWEHSRLSRNQYASAIIFNLFEKENIKIFEKDREFDLKDPQTKLFRGILDVMAEYERSLILGRITRGMHNRINQGKRSFGRLYGYKKVGLDSKGFQVLEKVESEMENVKHAYKRVLEGATLYQIALELCNDRFSDKFEALRVSRHWLRLLTHFSYTGHELNMAGLEVVKKFNDFEIDSLSAINDERYYSKSAYYPCQLVSIENWIRTVEKLRTNRKSYHRNKMNKASKDLLTGLIACSECGQKYYSGRQKYDGGKKSYTYKYYKHLTAMRPTPKCSQQKSFGVENLDNIFKLFFFYYYMIFDNTAELLAESRRIAAAERMKLKELITQYEKTDNQLKNQTKKFNLVLDDTDDAGEIKVLAKRINDTEEKIKENYENLEKAKVELERIREQYAGTEASNAYYDAKNRIGKFFKMNTEGRRDDLIMIIKKCLVFGRYLLIDTGKVLFVFDTARKYLFKEELLNWDKERLYKEHFSDLLNADGTFLDVVDLGKEAARKRRIFQSDVATVFECKLYGQDERFNTMAAKSLFSKFKIDYDFSEHRSIVFFPETAG